MHLARPVSTMQRRALVLTVGAVAPVVSAVVRQVLQDVSQVMPQVQYPARWLHSARGEPVSELCGETPSAALPPDEPHFVVCVLASPDVEASPALLQQIRSICSGGAQVLGVEAGAALLAEAGVLQQGRAAVHWALLDAMLEDHPQIVWSDRLWDGEGRYWSCGAGLAVVELMLAWLCRVHGEGGESLQAALLERLGLEQVRPRETRQRRPLSERLGGGSPKLAEALALMEANLAEPLPTEEIARLVGVSRRQLERLFKRHLDALPSRHYAELRLQRARRLLQQSAQSILQIGLSCGFASGPHFSNAYKAFFGHTPRDERSQRAASLRLGPLNSASNGVNP